MLHYKIETRKYNTHVRGPVLIYTTKKRYAEWEWKAICGSHVLQYAMTKIIEVDKSQSLDGYAIAVGNMTDSRPMVKADEPKALVEYHPSLFSWIFEDVKRIEPFKYEVKLPHSDKMVSAGGQGWGWVPEELMSKIKYI